MPPRKPRPVVTANSHYPIFRVSRTVSPIPLGHFLVAITRGPEQALFSTSMFAGRRVDFLLFSPSIIPSRCLSLFIILVHPTYFSFSLRSFLRNLLVALYSSLFRLGARALFVFSPPLLFSRFALPNFLLQRSRLIFSFSLPCFNPLPFQGFFFSSSFFFPPSIPTLSLTVEKLSLIYNTSSSFVPPLETFNNPTDRVSSQRNIFLPRFSHRYSNFHHFSRPDLFPLCALLGEFYQRWMERDDDEETREPSTKRKKREITIALRHNRSVYRAYLFPSILPPFVGHVFTRWKR